MLINAFLFSAADKIIIVKKDNYDQYDFIHFLFIKVHFFYLIYLLRLISNEQRKD